LKIHSFLTALQGVSGIHRFLTDPADCWAYGVDNSKEHHLPDAVLFPTSAEAVQNIVQACATYQVPLTARGRGTGTPGGAVPIFGGVVLCFEYMNRIVKTYASDRVVIVEPGLLNGDLQKAVRQEGLFWAPDPSSQDYCTVGGNLAHNSAGPHALKYGTPRENTLGLVFVDGQGRLIKTGVQTSKGVVGYDLTRLLIGSEGTLGIIVEATLKLLPLPEKTITLQVFYRSIEDASMAIIRVLQSNIMPAALEMMDSGSLALIRQHQSLAMPQEACAMLLIELEGTSAGAQEAAEYLTPLLSGEGFSQLHKAETAAEKSALWAVRKALSPTLRQIAPNKINEDIVIPISEIPTFVHFVETLSHKHQLSIISFGHAGNGNLHVNILYDAENLSESKRATICLEAIFDKVLALRGTLSGEHGIGLLKKAFIGRELSQNTLDLMKSLKHTFDPHGILNPGKIFP
jgi:D-lactate dehydrogenase (quinone)